MKNKSPNKGVQRTLHKVSGPLTPDVRQKTMNMKRGVIIVAVAILCAHAAYSEQDTANLQAQAQCKGVISAIAADIVALKTNFTELANFAPANPIMFGNVIPTKIQQQELRITYFNNSEYVNGPGKKQGHYRLKPAGCILNIQIFPDGGSWAGFLLDEHTRNLDERSEATGARIQASIQTQNEELIDCLEKIIRDRFRAIE